MEEKDKALKKIDKASEFFGLDSSKRTVFEISQGEDNEKKLTLKSGSWSDEEPWFGIDENNEVHTMISIKSLANLIAATKNAMQENFNLKLERSILQHTPVDFGDAWIVCMDEIRRLTGANPNAKRLSLDVDAVVSRVKSLHPNLFIDIEELIKTKAGGRE
ncbi:DUF2603 domain-containing protein [uncultured Campylobacter sp.]|jgi:hypothetical protein|uniref:DUF2603 domain-containing protein n=1 Tax=uncultured Campylobacter sp. TaxID=218934 RepID=UPI000F254632|nr:DUF2603 domain-containing protein [uncultured Campylobacter sp.]RKV94488.1 MAG: DUF2603 domain-containing protein [Campylobacter sp.]